MYLKLRSTKLRSTFILSVFALFIGGFNNSLGQCCTYTLEMNDSYGDGWNGASVSINVNGVDQGPFTFTSGSSASASISVCPGDAIDLDYTSEGSFPTEVSFTFIDAESNVIYNSGASPSVGNDLYTGSGFCPPSCTDGMQNQDETGVDCGGTACIPCYCTNGIQDVDETGIDCGGSCNVCPTCFDGIQNGTETGIDCGGSCALVCTTNDAAIDGTSTNCCSTTTPVNVYPTNCDQIGTSAYNLNSPVVNLTSGSVSGPCMPAGSPTGCGTYEGAEGTWSQYNLEPGSSYLQLAPLNVNSFGSGNSFTYHAYFQGTSCADLNFVSCSPAIQFSSGDYFYIESSATGLDPNQDVWVYTWNDNNKAFNYEIQAVGAAPASNTSCPGSTALGEACNLGAQGAAFTTPGVCDGGNWGSNENTTFYSFTADATSGSLIIEDIICNDGTSGSAQFGVWTSCATIGTYGAEFLGCAVGTGEITLSPLVDGQTYYIAADGFAGDNCIWAFTGTGIVLPIKLVGFYGYHTGKNVELFWSTATERNNDYFTIQRTLDGITFEDIGFTPGAGTSTSTLDYSFIDFAPFKGTSYYRIKQTDYDGKFEYSEILSVRSDKEGLKLIKTVNIMGQEVNMNYSGMIIDIYEDGSKVKRIKN